jgi:hypothetical protein
MVENAKHHCENRSRTLGILVVFAFCFFLRLHVHGQVGTIQDPSHIGVYITPWYNSAGPEIQVGKFSSGLASTNEATFVNTVHEMKKSWSKLNFTEMYVAAIRLYDLGYRNESVYWFYSAQYRARLFAALLDGTKAGSIGDPGFELLHAGGAFHELVGPYINGYGAHDIDAQCQVIQRVQQESKRLPDMKAAYPGVIFKKESEWPIQNQEIGNGLSELLSLFKEKKTEIKEQRIKNGVEAQFGTLPSREFPGGSEKSK